MSEEKVVLVDNNNNVLGEALKAEVHTDNTPLHRAFSVFLFTPKGELLLQQRSVKKKTWPLVWSNSCCGHPLPGESTKEAALRRVNEELGVTIDQLWEVLPNFRYRAELDGIVENELCPVFVGFIEKNEVATNNDEIEAIEWISWDKFFANVQQPDSMYSPWSILEAKELQHSKTFRDLLATHAGSSG